jgi:hypothetical protein
VLVRLDDPAAIYTDTPQIVAESSPLFWNKGTIAQVLLEGAHGGGSWLLGLTRWGVLRWELRPAGSAAPTAAVETGFSLESLVDTGQPFYAAVALRWSGERTSVALVVGQAGAGRLSVEGSASLERACAVLPCRLTVGEGADAARPFAGRIDEVLVANTTRHALFSDGRAAAAIAGDFPGGSMLGAWMCADGSAEVSSGVDLDSTDGNYWYCMRVDDPSVRSLRFSDVGDMCTSFFWSTDRQRWQRLPMAVDGRSPQGTRQAQARLPERAGALYVASAPIYGEQERDRDLERARSLGAEVHEVGRSTWDLPVHVVALTDPATPPAAKQAIVMLCGQHSPLEQMGGRLGMPCLETLLDLHRSGPTQGLLRNAVFYWIPLFNVDCARHGATGADARLTNPNRCWFVNRGPIHEAVQRFFLARRDDGVRFALMLDIHGGGIWRNHTVLPDYDCQPDNPDLSTAALNGPDLRKAGMLGRLDRIAGLREVWHNGRATTEKKRAPEWFQHTFGCPAFTIECSVVSQLDPATRRTRAFTQESFETLGRNLARFFAEEVAPSLSPARGGPHDEHALRQPSGL